MAGEVEEGARAPFSHICHVVGCNALKWQRRVKLAKDVAQEVVVSNYCFEHSSVRMFEVPPEPIKKPPARRNPDAVFRSEVERRRLDPKDVA